MATEFKRKTNRMRFYDYSSNGVYFITICARDKVCIFADSHTFELSEAGVIAQQGIEQIGRRYGGVYVEKYVVMPNHVHILLYLEGADVSISTIVSQYKRYVSLCIENAVWQKSFYDHVVRNDADYQRIWQYIDTNPQKWTEDRYYTS